MGKEKKIKGGGGGEKSKTGSFYILGYLVELIIKIWQLGNFFFLEIWRIWAPLFFHGKSFG